MTGRRDEDAERALFVSNVSMLQVLGALNDFLGLGFGAEVEQLWESIPRTGGDPAADE